MWRAPGPVLPRPVRRERAGVRVIPITRCLGDFEHWGLATPAHRVRQVTLTLPSPGVPGEGSCRARAIALPHAARSGSLWPRRAVPLVGEGAAVCGDQVVAPA